MNKKLYLGAAVLGLLITTGVVAGISEASQGRWLNKNSDQGGEMHRISEFESYTEFVSSVGEDSKIAEKITEEKFNEMLEARASREEGGLKGSGEGRKACQDAEEGECPLNKIGRRGNSEKNKMTEEAMTALETGTYEEWLAVAGEDCKMAEKVNADNFAQFQAMHVLKKEGKFEESKVIAEELGMFDFAAKRGAKKPAQAHDCSSCPNNK